MIHIFDTGPLFKFLTTDCVPQLLAALGNNVIHVPQAVEDEINDTPNRHPQFKRATEVWNRKLPERFKQIISDRPTDELRRCCRSVLGIDFDQMYAQRKDRGENMAILHGVLRARAGHKVILICDDEGGIALIRRQASILRMQHMQGLHVPGGQIQLAKTVTLLEWAIQSGKFESKEQLIKKYQAMAQLDSALPSDIKDTGLLNRSLWTASQENN